MRCAAFRLLLSAVLLLAGDPRAGTVAAAEAAPRADEIPAVLIAPGSALLSARIETAVVRLCKEMGDVFAEGEPLVEFEDTLFRAERDRAQAILTSAEAKSKAREALYEDRAVSDIELAEARAEAAAARAAFAAAEKRLSFCTIRAPWAGRVVTMHVRAHEMVQPGQKILEIVDDRKLQAQFLLPASLLPSLRPGLAVRLRIRETGREAEGALAGISPVIDPSTSLVKVLADLPNPDGSLRAGMRGVLRPAQFAATGAAK